MDAIDKVQRPRDPIAIAADLVLRGDKLSVEAGNSIKRLHDACKAAFTMVGHGHWDDTMQHGAGCVLCQRQREACEKIRYAMNDH